MANSRRSSRPEAADVGAAVAAALDDPRVPAGRYAVALSGGRDSIALLDAVVAYARPRGRDAIALHVHHGLSPNADHWASACETAARLRGIRCIVRRVAIARAARTSLEASARRCRYDALAGAAREADAHIVLLAHHRDDQAETLLLQLLRGAGPHGLAAMPARRDADGLTWIRPLLDVPRAAIDAYGAQLGLRHVDDASNADLRFARNALRRCVLPALAEVAPAYARTIARAATLQADAARLADDLAAIDARIAVEGGTLDCAVLAQLPAHRGRNLLRGFLRAHALPPPSAARLSAMLDQLVCARGDARVRLSHAGVEIGIHRGRAVVHPPRAPAYESKWRGEAALDLPHGKLAFNACAGGGLDLARLENAPVVVRPRRGGERLTLDTRGPARALKRMLQESGLSPWERAALPLLFCGDALAAVPCIGVDVAFRAPPGRRGIALVWTPAPRE
jgi:tRNA(Ile)-lysidine synthase